MIPPVRRPVLCSRRDMFTVTFGRPVVPRTVRAKRVMKKLSKERDDFANYRYIDIHAEGITKSGFGKTVGNLVKRGTADFCRSKTYRRLCTGF